jgi:hypothetical protein
MAHLTKPFDIKQVRRLVAEVLAASEPVTRPPAPRRGRSKA